MNKLLQMNVLTLVGVLVGFVGTIFVVVWMLQGHLEPGDMMWATIIVASTTAVMFVFIGELNRREGARIDRETERDSKTHKVMQKHVDGLNAKLEKITGELASTAGDLAQLQAGQRQTADLILHLLKELGMDKADRATWAAGWVARADQEPPGSGGGKVHLLRPTGKPEDGK